MIHILRVALSWADHDTHLLMRGVYTSTKSSKIGHEPGKAGNRINSKTESLLMKSHKCTNNPTLRVFATLMLCCYVDEVFLYFWFLSNHSTNLVINYFCFKIDKVKCITIKL